MANSAQARKRARQAEKTRQRNAGLKSSLRSAVKKVRKSIAAGDKTAAAKELQAQQSIIDRIADKKIVQNTASRSKMRLAGHQGDALGGVSRTAAEKAPGGAFFVAKILFFNA